MNKRNQNLLLKKLLQSAALDCCERLHPADAEEAVGLIVACVANDEDRWDQKHSIDKVLRDEFEIDADDDDRLDEIKQAIKDRANELEAERAPFIEEIAKVVAERMDLGDVDEDGALDDQALHNAVIAAPIKITHCGKEFAVTYVPSLQAVEVTPTIRIRLFGLVGTLSFAVADYLQAKIENSREDQDDRQPAEPTKEPGPEIT